MQVKYQLSDILRFKELFSFCFSVDKNLGASEVMGAYHMDMSKSYVACIVIYFKTSLPIKKTNAEKA